LNTFSKREGGVLNTTGIILNASYSFFDMKKMKHHIVTLFFGINLWMDNIEITLKKLGDLQQFS